MGGTFFCVCGGGVYEVLHVLVVAALWRGAVIEVMTGGVGGYAVLPPKGMMRCMGLLLHCWDIQTGCLPCDCASAVRRVRACVCGGGGL